MIFKLKMSNEAFIVRLTPTLWVKNSFVQNYDEVLFRMLYQSLRRLEYIKDLACAFELKKYENS